MKIEIFMWNKCLNTFSLILLTLLLSAPASANDEPEASEPIDQPVVYSLGAELFGIPFNDLSKDKFEEHLAKIGLEPY
ncbi:MAG: hypothetical protein VXY99_01500, partial [Pseudomonadota bacterium]|nr:hypothetical protein [Pseudomonadota bacterium]